MKKSMDVLKAKAERFNVLKTPVGKRNTQLAINEFKLLDQQKKVIVEIAKN